MGEPGAVVILEKSGMVGGTTAMSGGMLWIPLNHHQPEHGVEDSFDEVVAYLDALAPEMLDPDAVSGFLEGGPEMVRFMADHTPGGIVPAESGDDAVVLRSVDGVQVVGN